MTSKITNNPLAHINLPANPTFIWKQASASGNKRIAVHKMETRHLFFTLRMIWNHRMPPEYHLLPYRQYALNYPDDYLIQAIYAIAAELSTRKDLEARWKSQLEKMASFFHNKDFPALPDK